MILKIIRYVDVTRCYTLFDYMVSAFSESCLNWPHSEECTAQIVYSLEFTKTWKIFTQTAQLSLPLPENPNLPQPSLICKVLELLPQRCFMKIKIASMFVHG